MLLEKLKRLVRGIVLWRFVRRPSWTTERPTRAGYYWVRAPKLTSRVSHFYHAHGQPWLTNDYLHLDFAYGTPVEYAGPLPSPNTVVSQPRGQTPE
jgi:hypothetical protein